MSLGTTFSNEPSWANFICCPRVSSDRLSSGPTNEGKADPASWRAALSEQFARSAGLGYRRE